MSDLPAQLRAAAASAQAAHDASEAHDTSSAVSLYASTVAALSQAQFDANIALAAASVAAEDLPAATAAARRATAFAPDGCGAAWYWTGYAGYRAGDSRQAAADFARAAAAEKNVARRMSYTDWEKRCLAESMATAAEREKKEGAGKRPDKAEEGGGSKDGDAEQGAEKKKLMPRMDWYQSNDMVTVDLFLRGVDVEQSQVVFGERSLNVQLVRQEELGGEFTLLRDPLFAEVVTQECRWSCSKFKAEIKLKKKNVGLSWTSLGATGEDLSAQERARRAREAVVNVSKQKESDGARGTAKKDWDAIATAELGNDTGDSDPMGVFKSIYAEGDDDMRRAMMKSYQESGGKVLSTNWADVKARKVEYNDDK